MRPALALFLTLGPALQGFGILESGNVVERALRAQETHSYRLRLETGQYVRVVAECKGIDIALALYGPGGERVAARDRTQGFGYETLSWIAEESGDYYFEVRPFTTEAPPGRYQAKVEDLRPATPEDRHRVAGEEAETAANSWTGGWRSAIENYEKALLEWRAAGDRPREADVLASMLYVFSVARELPRQLETATQALELERALGDPRRQAAALARVGFAFRELGETQKALDCYREALALAQAAGDNAQGAYLSSIGTIYADLGDLDAALDSYRRALPFVRISGASYEAQTLDRIGDVYVKLGERDRALEAKTREVDIWRAEGRVPMLALALDRLGEACVEFGEHRRALEYFTEALALYRSRRLPDGQSRSLTDLGLVHERLGEKEKALDLYQQALDLGGIYESYARMRAGAIYASIGQWSRALEHYTAALPQFRKWSDPKGEADALSAMGEAHAALGNVAEARRCFEATLETIETRRARVASPELRALHLSSNRRYYESYINLLMQLNRTRPAERLDAAALEVSERARARALLDLLNEARADVRQGADPTLLDERRRLEARIDALEQRRLSAPKGRAEPSDDQEVKSLILEHRDLEERIRLKSPRYAALIQPRSLRLDDIQRQVLDPETLLVEFFLGDEKSYVWAVTSTAISAHELPGRAVIEAKARDLYSLLVARQPVPKETIRQLQRRTRQADAKYADLGASLSQLLLGPVASRLGGKRLLVVADGALHYLPFAALPVPGTSETSLAATREVVSVPSASALALLRLDGPRPLPPREVAVFADPVFDAEDSRVRRQMPDDSPSGAITLRRVLRDSGLELARLPFSRREADAILAMVPPSRSLRATDFDASRDRVRGTDINNYRIVHFATHALVSNRHPELSGLVLSLVDSSGAPRNGFLRLPEIYNLKLSADLVVLSACSTALGQEMKGEGLVGLVRGFMYAGAPRVLASLWKVDDEAAAELMARFYSNLLRKGLAPAAALRAAQAEMRMQKRWSSPYYWAAFVLQGEW